MGIKVQNEDIFVSHHLPVRKTYQGTLFQETLKSYFTKPKSI